ncbi:hypothetical protein L6452_35163 [Arctium lappa]|uniref:Uncharacterized protein n=1 Tax=Arctium lappa TaxID=4217 RepID=A0ACB8YKQ4_ARCLA|nr:hypothetical protein L6452_35163 [Arctium lappa]
MGTGDQSPPQTTRIPTGEAWSGATRCVNAQADVPSAEWLRAQLAFKNSMVHGILQFTPSIAILLRSSSMREPRYPLPRVVYGLMRGHDPCTHRKRGNTGRALLKFGFPWHMPFSGILATSPAANRPRRRDPNTSPTIQSVGATGRCVQRAGDVVNAS